MDKLPNDIIMDIIQEAEIQYGGSYWRLHNKKFNKKCITKQAYNNLAKIHNNEFMDHVQNIANILNHKQIWSNLEGFSLKEQIHMFNRDYFGYTPWVIKLRRNPWWIVGKNRDIDIDIDFSIPIYN